MSTGPNPDSMAEQIDRLARAQTPEGGAPTDGTDAVAGKIAHDRAGQAAREARLQKKPGAA